MKNTCTVCKKKVVSFFQVRWKDLNGFCSPKCSADYAELERRGTVNKGKKDEHVDFKSDLTHLR